MRVLLCHSFYQVTGGEDTVFRQELAALPNVVTAVDSWTLKNEDYSGSRNLKRFWQLFYSPLIAKNFTAKIDEFKPDIVHFHNYFPFMSLAPFSICKRRGIPVVVTVHNYRLSCIAGLFVRSKVGACTDCLGKKTKIQGIIRRCYRSSFLASILATLLMTMNRHFWIHKKYVSRFICLTNFAKQKLLTEGVTQDRIVVKANGISKSSVATTAQVAKEFCYLGRIVEEKGVFQLVEYWLSRKQGKLIIAGSGEGVARLEHRLKNVSKERIEFLGPLNRMGVIDLLQKSRALIIPSLCIEGMPMVIIEAYSMGVPVIARNLGPLQDLVGRVGAGLMFSNEAEFNCCIDRVLNDSALCKKMSEAALKAIRDEFKIEIVLKKQIEIYADVLNEAKSELRR